MENRFYKNNFRKTVPAASSRRRSTRFSDNLYDNGKGINFYYLNIGTVDKPVYRTLSDVELAYSNSPSVQAIVPPQVQQGLRLGLSSMRHSDVSTEIPMPRNLELSERVEITKTLLAKHSDVVSAAPTSVSSVTTPPSAPDTPPSVDAPSAD